MIGIIYVPHLPCLDANLVLLDFNGHNPCNPIFVSTPISIKPSISINRSVVVQ